MNNEIKEILDKLKSGFCSALTYEKLLDYITNLQKKYDKALTDLVKESHTRMELENKITDLQEENEKLLEKFSNKIEEVSDLIKENERLKERCEYLQRSCKRKEEQMLDYRMEYMEQEDYKSRNEKAIEFIEHENFKRKLLGFSENKYLKNIQKELIEILKGEDK